MAKARTLLLTATLEPSVDWVLWLDSDLDEAPPSLIADLMYYGNAGTTPAPELPKGSKERLADVICPNVVVKKHNTVETYDMNRLVFDRSELPFRKRADICVVW